MIVGLAIGGVIIGGVIFDDDGSYYSDYSNHSDYSDASYRRELRIKEKKMEIKKAKQELEKYKKDSVNGYLSNQDLISMDAENVPNYRLNNNATAKIDEKKQIRIKQDTLSYEQQVKEIDMLIEIIDEKLRGE